MMPFGLSFTADDARLPAHFPSLNGATDFGRRVLLMFRVRLSESPTSTVSIILSYAVDIPFAVLMDSGQNAGFALVEMAIGHPFVRIKLLDGFCN